MSSYRYQWHNTEVPADSHTLMSKMFTFYLMFWYKGNLSWTYVINLILSSACRSSVTSSSPITSLSIVYAITWNVSRTHSAFLRTNQNEPVCLPVLLPTSPRQEVSGSQTLKISKNFTKILGQPLILNLSFSSFLYPRPNHECKYWNALK